LNENDYYKYMEFVIFSSYLVFTFLAIQIWCLWKDIDKTNLKMMTFISESFFRKNCIYVFLFSIFFMIRQFSEAITLPNASLFFEFFDMLAFVSIVLFAKQWYFALKTCPNKKSLPLELTKMGSKREESYRL
jgi:hypothetical protein